MNDKELKKFVTGFTKGILDGGNTTDKCYVVCHPLQAYLSFCGFECKLTEGVLRFGDDECHHFWISYGENKIIDPTANQFNGLHPKKMPMVYVGENPGYYIPYTKKMIDSAFEKAIKSLNKVKIA